jgi:curli production assembly/transport component CsgG
LKKFLKLALCTFGFGLITACATPSFVPTTELSDAKINPETVTGHALRWVPAPPRTIPVAVYGIADETGAFKPSEGGQTLSRALTQAPTPLLIKALHDAGNRRWFNVIERENLANLIKERQIIQEMRQRYLGESQINSEALPALKFAGILIEGAITGYDTNMRTGGAGARYLGVGAFTQYREDSVSVYLRAVSVKTGEVLLSITSEQRVASVALQGDVFRFVSFQKLLEAEAGITFNQPRHLAVRQAIEKAVYGLIVEGAEIGLWAFEDGAAGAAAIGHYRENYAPVKFKPENADLPEEFYESHRRYEEQLRVYAQAPQVQPIRPQRPVQQRPQTRQAPPVRKEPVSFGGETPGPNPVSPATQQAQASAAPAKTPNPQTEEVEERKVASVDIAPPAPTSATPKQIASDLTQSEARTKIVNPTLGEAQAAIEVARLNTRQKVKLSHDLELAAAKAATPAPVASQVASKRSDATADVARDIASTANSVATIFQTLNGFGLQSLKTALLLPAGGN